MNVFTEGSLTFDFSKADDAIKLDRQGVPLPDGMKLVDFVVEHSGKYYLIEVKDPSQSKVVSKHPEQFIKNFKTNELIPGFVEKCRDSYTYRHLMKKDDKPFLFIVLIVADKTLIDPTSLLPFRDEMFKRLRKETDIPWKRQYVADCLVLNLEMWEKRLTLFPIHQNSK